MECKWRNDIIFLQTTIDGATVTCDAYRRFKGNYNINRMITWNIARHWLKTRCADHYSSEIVYQVVIIIPKLPIFLVYINGRLNVNTT